MCTWQPLPGAFPVKPIMRSSSSLSSGRRLGDGDVCLSSELRPPELRLATLSCRQLRDGDLPLVGVKGQLGLAAGALDHVLVAVACTGKRIERWVGRQSLLTVGHDRVLSWALDHVLVAVACGGDGLQACQ